MSDCGYHIKYRNIKYTYLLAITYKLYKQIDFKAKIFLEHYKHNHKKLFFIKLRLYKRKTPISNHAQSEVKEIPNKITEKLNN